MTIQFKNFKIHPNPPIFIGYISPRGFLDRTRESHALWNYYLCARGAWERHVKEQFVLEGEKDPEAQFRQLFTSIATMYGVAPEAMAKCWPMIDKQCDAIGMPKLPNEERYRFDRAIVIVTRH